MIIVFIYRQTQLRPIADLFVFLFLFILFVVCCRVCLLCVVCDVFIARISRYQKIKRQIISTQVYKLSTSLPSPAVRVRLFNELLGFYIVISTVYLLLIAYL